MAVKHESALGNLEQRLRDIPDMQALLREERAVLVEEQNAASRVATLVREGREAAGLSQAALGQKLGVSQSRVSQLEQGNGTFGASVALIARAATACGFTLQLSLVPDMRAETQEAERAA